MLLQPIVFINNFYIYSQYIKYRPTKPSYSCSNFLPQANLVPTLRSSGLINKWSGIPNKCIKTHLFSYLRVGWLDV